MSQPSAGITSAIAAAARLTGASASYLTAAAQRESAFDPDAKASTSSAAGLFQFIEDTWLTTLSRHAERLGVEDAAKLPREDALALRFDPKLSALMAGALASDNAGVLEARLGRRPTDGELYAAHVLGASGAAKLLTTAQDAPDTSAASMFPRAASANRGLFYDRSGEPVTAAALAQRLTAHGQDGVAPVAEQSAPIGDGSAPLSSSPPPAAPVRLVALRAGRAPMGLSPQTIEILAALEPPERAEPLDDS